MYMFFYSFRLHIYNSCGKTASSYAIFLAEFCSEAEKLHTCFMEKTFLNKKINHILCSKLILRKKWYEEAGWVGWAAGCWYPWQATSLLPGTPPPTSSSHRETGYGFTTGGIIKLTIISSIEGETYNTNYGYCLMATFISLSSRHQ